MLQYKSFFGGDSFNLAAILESSGKSTDAYQNSKNIVVTHVSDLIRKESITFNKNYKKAFIKVRNEELNNNAAIFRNGTITFYQSLGKGLEPNMNIELNVSLTQLDLSFFHK